MSRPGFQNLRSRATLQCALVRRVPHRRPMAPRVLPECACVFFVSARAEVGALVGRASARIRPFRPSGPIVGPPGPARRHPRPVPPLPGRRDPLQLLPGALGGGGGYLDSIRRAPT